MNTIILFVALLSIFLFISLGINYSNIFSKTVSRMKQYKPTSILYTKYNNLTEYYSDTLAEQGVFSKTVNVNNPIIESLVTKQKTKTKPSENIETWGYKGPQGSPVPPKTLSTEPSTTEPSTTEPSTTEPSTDIPYGYCPDNVTVKVDENGSNCTSVHTLKYKGSNVSVGAVAGPNNAGYVATGPKGNVYYGKTNYSSCAGTQYGCCPDNVTAKTDSDGSNCAPYPPPVVGGCAGTQYGCCPDNVTAKVDSDGSNCAPYPPPVVGGCAGTQYGCCPDNLTAKVDSDGSNCSSVNVWKYSGPNVTAYAASGPNKSGFIAKGPHGNIFYGTTSSCNLSQYGCCPDNVTAKTDSIGSNCALYPPVVGGCAGTQYGCCPDNVTAKTDSNGSNCAPYPPPPPPPLPPPPPPPPLPPPSGCAGTQYGCCTDNVTTKTDSSGSNCAPYPPPPVQPITNTVFIPPPKQFNVTNYETTTNNESVDSSSTGATGATGSTDSTNSTDSSSLITPTCPTPQPCPPCGRCPEPSFDCKKVPNYASTNSEYLPMPVLTDFSQFGM
jgi:hypothetical protein